MKKMKIFLDMIKICEKCGETSFNQKHGCKVICSECECECRDGFPHSCLFYCIGMHCRGNEVDRKDEMCGECEYYE